MKKIFWRLSAFLLSLLLIMALVPTALADSSDTGSDTGSDAGDNTGDTEDTGDGGTATIPPGMSFGIRLTPETVTLNGSGTKALSYSVGISNPNSADVPDYSIDWATSDESIATVTAADGTTPPTPSPCTSPQGTVLVNAVGPGNATITATVTVGGEAAPNASATVSVSVGGVTLSAPDNRTQLVIGAGMQMGITRSGAAENIALSDWRWTVDNSDIASVNTSGYVTGISEGSVTITCRGTYEGVTFEASYGLSIVRNRAASIDGYLTNGLMSFSSLITSFTGGCQSLLGSSLSYITNLSVSPSQGTLYIGYVSESDTGSGVATSQVFYLSGSGSLQTVTFVPKSDFTGTATISYTGYAVNGQSYTGEVLVTVSRSNSTEISYSVKVGESVSFRAADFSSYCYNTTGRPVSYVLFTPPAARYGTLYYNYTSPDIYEGFVYANTRYYRTDSPTIDRITFVPNENFEGSFTISFTMYDSSGGLASGSIRMTVSNPAGGTDTAITYTVRTGEKVYLNEDDFTQICYDETGYGLNYIRFTSIAYTSYGSLYNGSNSRASTGVNYYLSGSTYLISNLNFYANGTSSDNGTVTLVYTGVNTRGGTFSGTVLISVVTGGALSYTVKAGQRVYFDEDDFAEASFDSTGYGLSSIRLDGLPDYSKGTLYAGTTAAVTGASYYYRTGSSGRLLRELNFVASSDYHGTLVIPFTGYDVHGSTFPGEITIVVSPAGSAIKYELKSGQKLRFDPEDFSDASYDETGYELSYIRFTSLPTSSQGTLYANDSNTRVYLNSAYYYSGSYSLLKNMNFVASSSFTGSLELPFTGMSVHGTSFSGTLTLTVTAAGTVKSVYYESTGPAVSLRPADFSAALENALSDDLASIRFSAPSSSLGTLYLDYISPIQHSDFSSTKSYALLDVSRISFLPKARTSGAVYITYTATDASGNTCSGSVRVQVSEPTVSAYFDDMENDTWAVQSVDFLRYYNILLGSDGNGFDPRGLTRRADFILMLSRVFTFAPADSCTFRDVYETDYYYDALASAQALGIVESTGTFSPLSPITFEDAIVYLYRCLKLSGDVEPGTAADLLPFVDRGQVSSGAVEAMGALVRLGVVLGDDTDRLRPQEPLARSQMAALIHRMVA